MRTIEKVAKELGAEVKVIDFGECVYKRINDNWDIEIDGYWHRENKQITLRVWDISKGLGHGAKIRHTIRGIKTVESLKYHLVSIVDFYSNDLYELVYPLNNGDKRYMNVGIETEEFAGKVIFINKEAQYGILKVDGKRGNYRFTPKHTTEVGFNSLEENDVVDVTLRKAASGKHYGDIYSLGVHY